MSLILSRWRAIASWLLFLYCFIVWLVIILLIAAIIVAIATGGTGVIGEIPVGLILTVIIGALTVLMLVLTFVVLPIVFLLDLLLNFYMNWKLRGWKVAVSRFWSEANENWGHIITGAKEGISDFTKKLPGGQAIIDGVSRLAGGMKAGIDESKKLVEPLIEKLIKWWKS